MSGDPAGGSGTLHVLVVDDSAVIRQALAQILGEAGFTVDTAADPLIGLAKMERTRPDVILLDLEMPRMDGLTFLRRLMAEHPLPVVILSSHAERGTETALQALEVGAIDVLAKPPLGVREFLDRAAARLVEVVQAASRARLPMRLDHQRQPRPAPHLPERPRFLPGPRLPVAVRHPRSCQVIALAASTGGPETLRTILSALPDDVPGLVVVQHMPRVFTGTFARRLDTVCRIAVAEAEDGEPLTPGRALIAPGGRHLEVARLGDTLRVRLSDGPPVGRHRPSADVLFRSVARAAGAEAVGVILTGMGHDGAEGLLAMRCAGAATLAQDEASSVVFGMPASAVAAGAVQRVVGLDALPGAILARAGRAADVDRPDPTSQRATGLKPPIEP